jgi:MOSC domain-containing protein YiiM
LGLLGLEGDAQGDTKHHGGPEKALHQYCFDHYAEWGSELGDIPILMAPGAFGENISAGGLNEHSVAVGDVFALGDAVIEVSQGRQPCWKLNERFDIRDMAYRVQATGRTGWYYRVRSPGTIHPGDQLRLLDRRSPEWNLHRIWKVFYVDTLNRHELEEIAVLPSLSEGWKRHAMKRLQTQRVEDWTFRLSGSHV